MNNPLVSVVVPAYNQAEFLHETISSVLDQTYSNFEIIVIDDDSPDHTAEVVKQFDDSRIRYFVHSENYGLPASSNTGIKASSGEIIALLDADDKFHPEKLQLHVNFLKKNPHIGVSYSNRFELNHSAKTIRGIWRPPKTVSLVDFVLGFPICPSDIVMRREWAYRVSLFREEFTCGGEDLDFFCRLAISGCNFARVDRSLIYRRYHSGRMRKKLTCRLDDYTKALDTVFENSHCPEDIVILRNKSYASHYLEVAYYALLQGEINLGQEIICEVIRLDPTLLEGFPVRIINYFLYNIVKDENNNHEKILRKITSHFPFDISELTEQTEWAVGRGYILRGTRAVIWDRIDEGQEHFTRAKSLGVQIDESFIQEVVVHLLNFEAEFGPESTEEVLRRLSPYLDLFGKPTNARWLRGCYYFNRGLKSFRAEDYEIVPENVLRAAKNRPRYLLNRGFLSIMSRSLLHSLIHSSRN